MRPANPAWKNHKDWEDYKEQIKIANQNKRESEKKAPLLLCDIFIVLFRMYRYFEKNVKDINLIRILLVLYFYENLSQADIAKLYDMPTGTVGTVIAKYTKARKTKSGIVKNSKNTNNIDELIELIPDIHRKNRKILKLTPKGLSKAKELLFFMETTVMNLKTVEGKTLTMAYSLFEPVMNELTMLCRCVTGANDTLNYLTEYKKARV